MKLTLEFTLPEEQAEAALAQNAGSTESTMTTPVRTWNVLAPCCSESWTRTASASTRTGQYLVEEGCDCPTCLPGCRHDAGVNKTVGATGEEVPGGPWFVHETVGVKA